MMYFLYALKTELYLRLRSRGSHVFFLLAGALTLWMLLFPGVESRTTVQVGVVLPDNGGEEFLSLLQENSGGLVEYISVSEDTLDIKILSGEWDCGFVLSEDFEKNLKKLELRRLITMKTGPASTVYPIIQESVSACIMELVSPYVAESYLKSQNLDPQLLKESVQRWNQEDGWVQVHMETEHGEPLQPLQVYTTVKNRIFTGILAILCLSWGLYLAADMGKWLRSPAAERMSALLSTTQLLLPKLTAAMVPVCAWGVGLLLLLGSPVMTYFGFVLFLLLLIGLCLVLSRFSGLWQSLLAVIPFLVVTSLLLEPVLLDTGMLFPRLTQITRWLPVTLFLESASGKLYSLVVLMGEMVTPFIFSLMLDQYPMKK